MSPLEGFLIAAWFVGSVLALCGSRRVLVILAPITLALAIIAGVLALVQS